MHVRLLVGMVGWDHGAVDSVSRFVAGKHLHLR